MAGFPPGLFRDRRERVLDALGDGAMVLPAAPTRFRSRDTEYTYRPDSELFYLTGFTGPGAVAVLRGFADEDRYVLFVRERDEEAERWSGPRVGPQGASDLYGADRTSPLGELEEALPELLGGARGVHYRLGPDRRTQDLVERALALARRKGPRRGTGPRTVVDPGEILDEMRLVKDEEELGRIRRACGITVEAFRAAARAVAPGAGEWEVEAELERAVRRAGAAGPGFPTIVGGGANACVLHYDANGARLAEGEAVLVDAGAEVDLYHADVTRTFPVSGEWSPEQRDLYGVVESARLAGVGALRPGSTTADVHEAALGELVDGMVALGLLSGDREEILEEGKHKRFFPHQTSHWLGLDVHDPGDYARKGEPRELVPGMVLTIEPGLYVPPGSGGAAAPFAGVGVRIEDDVLVTGQGAEVLSRELPTEPDEVAELVG